MVNKYFHIVLLLCLSVVTRAQQREVTLHFPDAIETPKGSAFLLLDDNTYINIVQGKVNINLPDGKHGLMVRISEFQDLDTVIATSSTKASHTLRLKPLGSTLNTFEMDLERAGVLFEIPDVRGTSIYAGKKTEMFRPKETSANLATNTSRQIYQTIPGLNIWENDASGLQLNIGSRGLDPNRTSNFNTRQNGHDISADALGYPESYYTPPPEAVDRIEFVRGAASLQYGPHFGGLLNYQLKSKENRKLVARQSLTTGSFGFFQSFTSLGGQSKKSQYYAFYQRKEGRQYRPNSNFDQNTAFASYNHLLSKNIDLTITLTHMDYLAQQPGGLVDFEFEQDPYQVKRERNWFKVNWNIASANLTIKLSDSTLINGRFFYLHADRLSVGELSRPHRPDPGLNRDLISGRFRNIGSEWRLLHSYSIGAKVRSKLLTGVRLYKGHTSNQQGFGNDEQGANFEFINPEDPGVSDYRFPATNVAFFTENILQVKQKWFFTPGIRYEFIKTTANGNYKNRLISGGRLIHSDTVEVSKSNTRHFPLLGLGVSYRSSKNLEWVANITQNYKAINFSDLTVANPNLLIDTAMQDESGYNLDLGVRGKLLNKSLWFDVSLFCLKYNNRIGLDEVTVERNGINQQVAYRTNIGNAYSAGIESYLDLDVLKVLKKRSKPWRVNLFANGSFIHGRYVTGGPEFVEKELEFVIPIIVKSGVRLGWKSWYASYQFSYQSDQFTDATNAIRVADGTRGLIPAFSLHDVHVGWKQKRWGAKASINNLANRPYFTRRALSYPGPGIIPGEPRSVYITLRYMIQSSN